MSPSDLPPPFLGTLVVMSAHGISESLTLGNQQPDGQISDDSIHSTGAPSPLILSLAEIIRFGNPSVHPFKIIFKNKDSTVQIISNFCL